MSDLSDWMSKLPAHLHDVPLCQLAIPGSHNTFTYCLDPHSDIGPDAPADVQNILKLMGKAGKDVLNRWSVNQHLDITHQLNLGIRYLDCRVATHHGSHDLFFLHGLYGSKVEPCLHEINRFLNQHKSEIVIIDFNHLYKMTEESHKNLLRMVTDIFDSKICPFIDFDSVTLSMLWENNLQVIVIYHDDIVKDYLQFWPSSSIHAPWPNTVHVHNCIGYLDNVYKSHRPENKFCNFQGILTPDTGTIIMHFLSSLKETLADKMSPFYVSWLKDKCLGKTGINICTMDFVEMADFIPTVIALNK